MILAVKLDGSYRWQCDDCGAERNEYPHGGPRHSLCKRCQNIRYRAGRSPAQVAFERMGAAQPGLPSAPLGRRLGDVVRRMPGFLALARRPRLAQAC